MIVLACDPDTQHSGLALADEGRVYAVGVVNTQIQHLRGPAAAVAQGMVLGNRIVDMSRIGTPGSSALDHDTDWGPCCCGAWHGVAPTRFVVEAQQVYGAGKANANNLIPLAMVAGAAAVAGYRVAGNVKNPLPREWKGQLKKGPSHRATLEHYGIAYTRGKRARDPVAEVHWPEDVVCFGPVQQHLSEVVDALGLALWGTTV